MKSAKAFMRYVVSRFERESRETAYRIYVTNCLKMLCGNTGNAPAMNFHDIIERKRNIDTRSGEEIAADVIKRAGLKVVTE